MYSLGEWSTRNFNVGTKAYAKGNKEIPDLKWNKGSGAFRARSLLANPGICKTEMSEEFSAPKSTNKSKFMQMPFKEGAGFHSKEANKFGSNDTLF